MKTSGMPYVGYGQIGFNTCSGKETFGRQFDCSGRSSQLHAVCRHKVITEGALHTVFFFFLCQQNFLFFLRRFLFVLVFIFSLS